jgi:hypothetical protein
MNFRVFSVCEAVDRFQKSIGTVWSFKRGWRFIHRTALFWKESKQETMHTGPEARWVKRLFIADNSALANGLGGPNPTLTTQALATRTAEKIFRLYFDGDPWVGKETPVSSIDPAVTFAVIKRGVRTLASTKGEKLCRT